MVGWCCGCQLLPPVASGTWRSPAQEVWLLWQDSQRSEAGATAEQFLIFVPAARPVALKMGPLGLVPVLVLFILLGRVQEPELVEGLLGSKYQGLALPAEKWKFLGGRNKEFYRGGTLPPSAWEPGTLGRRNGRYSQSFSQTPNSWSDAFHEHRDLSL